ncbi:aldose 1-epimerase family protein [Lacrimispora sp.]|uniref:aldose 1-epimerase family protein n=1 Tax=Lacrimispora sp. TaxID=2719234 RepID=UPI0028B064AF|nr:aldose 1-epimerase family protein [Lacrimispora sp.]
MDYVLKNQHLTVTFTKMGGALTSIKNEAGLEYLWQGDPKYWSGQAPVLFPICGSLRDERAVTKSGKEVRMPRHGIVRKEEFELESFTDDDITFSISSTPHMLSQYPFPFVLTITYLLKNNEVTVRYGIKNTGTEDMPCFIGGHPAFRCPLEPGEAYEEYEILFEKEEEESNPTPDTRTGLIDMENRTFLSWNKRNLPLSHQLFEQDSVIFDRISSRKVTLRHKEKKQGVELSFDGFPYLVIWSSANHGPFVALEPWTGLSTCSDEDDVLEHKRNHMSLKPGEEKQLEYKISII